MGIGTVQCADGNQQRERIRNPRDPVRVNTETTDTNDGYMFFLQYKQIMVLTGREFICNIVSVN